MRLHQQNKITRNLSPDRENRAKYLDQFDREFGCKRYDDFCVDDKDTYKAKFCLFPTRLRYRDPIFGDLYEGDLVWWEFVGAKKVVDKIGTVYMEYTDRYGF